jgi:hypothetical protein
MIIYSIKGKFKKAAREITSEEAGQIYQTNTDLVLKTTLTFMTLYHF